MKEARLPMGLRKDLHIKAITKIPEVRERWKSVYGREPNQGKSMSQFLKSNQYNDCNISTLYKQTSLQWAMQNNSLN